MKLIKPCLFIALSALPILTAVDARAEYPSAVLADAPKAYYRFNEETNRSLINKNIGSLGAAGDATNDLSDAGNLHSFPGAILGDRDRAVFFDFTTRTEIPFNPAFNTPNTEPFTVEAWLYPASDQTGNGMAPLANRWAQGGPRQGWVFFQRRPSEEYFGGERVGWAMRMYNNLDTSGHLEVISDVPYQIGKWQHVVAVYDPVGGDPLNATLTMYIDGVPVATNINTSGVQGYFPVTGDHDPAPNGQPAMALGNYNNANSSLNPWFGAIDEFAWYPSKLSDAQILAHYQNATNANRSVSYQSLIQSHNPVIYLRLNEIAPSPDIAVNMGDVRNAGNATHSEEVRHPVPGALIGRNKNNAVAYHNRNGRAVTTMPYLADNNPNAGIPFTFETWLSPMRDSNGGQSPVNNRWPKLGHRTGWVIFQRTPNLSYDQGAGEGHGWNFRMYNGVNGSGSDVTTGTDFQIGKWQHLVVTWEPQVQNGDLGSNGNDQWQGILTAYVDGVAVATNGSAIYAANTNPPEDGGEPADLGIGAYNAASTLGNNPFEGDIDELAFYNGFILTPEQILAHYQARTNSSLSETNYETLVMTAGFTGPERVGLPKTYLRFEEPAEHPVINLGTLGAEADGSLVLTANTEPGPRPTDFPGFGSSNLSLPLDGSKQWASLNNPPGLNITGQITLEAWIKPSFQVTDPARIISHGPQTLTDFPFQEKFGAVTNSTEVYLAIDGGGVNYSVGTRQILDGGDVTTSGASAPIPDGDLGGDKWIHLVGTFNGTDWVLYRNGVQLVSTPGTLGALSVTNAGWAIGSVGNGWAENFAGQIDEVAIYATGLSAQKVANHYAAATVIAADTLTITRLSNGSVQIAWPAGATLLQATSVTGPYSPVSGNPSSPLTVPADGTRFYRSSRP